MDDPWSRAPALRATARGAEVVVDRAALGAVLQRVVRVTAGRPARALEALHAALAGAVARYTLQADRRDLVQVPWLDRAAAAACCS